jgi:hypothetical protein
MHLAIVWLLACSKSSDSVGGGETDADTDTDTDSDTDSDTDTDTDADTDADTDTDTDTDTGPECVPQPGGLVAWWRAEKSTADAMGSFDASDVGVHYGKGEVGYAFDLAADGYAETNNVDPLYPKGSFSIEAWVQARAGDGNVMALYECGGWCPTGAAFSDYQLWVNPDGHLSFFVRDSTGKGPYQAGQELTDKSDFIDGSIHHVVALRNVETMRLEIYVDGALAIGEDLDPGVAGPLGSYDGEIDPLTLGGQYVGGKYTVAHLLDGILDEVSYYSVALTVDQISALHAAGSAGKCL